MFGFLMMIPHGSNRVAVFDVLALYNCVSGFGGLEVACWSLVRTRPKTSDF